MKGYFKEFRRQCIQDKIFDVVNYTVLTILLLIVLYPLYFIVIASFSSPRAVANGEVLFWPVEFSLKGYKELFGYKDIWMGYKNSIIYTFLGTTVNIIAVIPAAFALSRRELYGRNLVIGLYTFTMFFGGGLIPTYLLIQQLGLDNTIWALILPGAAGFYNIVVARTFFDMNIPGELYDAAMVDGCDYFKYFFKIIIPISTPIIAVMVLIHAVGHWNSYFGALIYFKDRDKFPLQLILREILVQNQNIAEASSSSIQKIEEQRQLAELIKYGVIIVSSLPVLIMYPFVQKHFVKGMMMGSVKG